MIHIKIVKGASKDTQLSMDVNNIQNLSTELAQGQPTEITKQGKDKSIQQYINI